MKQQTTYKITVRIVKDWNCLAVTITKVILTIKKASSEGIARSGNNERKDKSTAR